MSLVLEGAPAAAPVLEGKLVRLEPLEPLEHRHAADLAVAAEENRGTYAFAWVPRAEEVGDYVAAEHARAAAGRLAPYAQISTVTGTRSGPPRTGSRAAGAPPTGSTPSRSASPGSPARRRAGA